MKLKNIGLNAGNLCMKNKQETILSLKNLSFSFDESSFYMEQLNLDIHKGEILGLVGESGSGKSTIGKLLACLYNHRESSGLSINTGKLNFNQENANLFDYSYKELISFRKDVQYLFQNNRAAVHRNMTVEQTMMEAANIKYPDLPKEEKLKLIIKMLSEIGLLDQDSFGEQSHAILKQKSRDLSGGQIKRLALGRTLLMEPKVLIADEPLTGLDASRKGRVLKYLMDIWEKRKDTDNPLSIILISHDIGMVLRLSQRVLVIYGDLYSKSSQIVEENIAEAYQIGKIIHPYTRSLLSTSNYFKNDLSTVIEEISNKIKKENKIQCKYAPYCPDYTEHCSQKQELKIVNKINSHRMACSKIAP